MLQQLFADFAESADNFKIEFLSVFVDALENRACSKCWYVNDTVCSYCVQHCYALENFVSLQDPGYVQVRLGQQSD